MKQFLRGPQGIENAKIEISILDFLRTDGEKVAASFVQLHDHFVFRNICYIITDLLDRPLSNLIRDHSGKMPIGIIKRISSQILRGLAALHQLGMIHTDLKPDNILISCEENEENPSIRIIDFGCAVVDDESNDHLITTLPYRAPEVILKQRWNFSVDIWSAACVIVELCQGSVFFQALDEFELLAQHGQACGLSVRGRIRESHLRRLDQVGMDLGAVTQYFFEPESNKLAIHSTSMKIAVDFSISAAFAMSPNSFRIFHCQTICETYAEGCF
ncbi:hypothetical protein NX059_012289 [Plenodomus lindquistii]|nr:hypothetical protein NX059_012289 [Plenodomus lindquistii]